MTDPTPGFDHHAPLARATFGARLAGLILDALLYSLVGSVFVVPATGLVYTAHDRCPRGHGWPRCGPGQLRTGLVVAGILLGIVGVVAVAAWYLLALGRTGQTWGRRIAGVRVVDRVSGAPLGVGRALARQLAEQLLSANCVIGYLWMLWDPRGQTWHDRLTDSIVVRVPPASPRSRR